LNGVVDYMSRHEFENDQVLGVVCAEGQMELVKVRHEEGREEFEMGISTFNSKRSLPLSGEGIQYTIPSLGEELSRK
jgi:hypothetical protein